VAKLAAADAMTEHDQRLDLVDRLAADGDVERERSHRDGSRRSPRRVVQGDRGGGRACPRAGELDLHPAGLVRVRGGCDEHDGQRGEERAKEQRHVVSGTS
jgi:hypothetical protein